MQTFKFSLVLLSFGLLASCIVTGPQFTRVEKVLKLEIGMSQQQVEQILELQPYDFFAIDSLGNRTLIYKYRVTDRRTVPFFLKDTNGQKVRGKFVDLYATYNKSGVLTELYSRPTQSKIIEKRLNINNLITLLTVTAPAVFIYLGLTAP